MTSWRKKYAGLSLTELLIALAVIGIIAAFAVPQLLNSNREKAVTTQQNSALLNLQDAFSGEVARLGLPPMGMGPSKLLNDLRSSSRRVLAVSAVPQLCRRVPGSSMDVSVAGESSVETSTGTFYGVSPTWNTGYVVRDSHGRMVAADPECFVASNSNDRAARYFALTRDGQVVSYDQLLTGSGQPVIASANGAGSTGNVVSGTSSVTSTTTTTTTSAGNLQAKFPLIVKVVDLQGNAVSGVNISGPLSGVTNGSGQLVFDNLAAGSAFSLTASKPYYDTLTQTAIVTESMQPVVFTLGRWYPVSIAVSDLQWRPIANAAINGTARGTTNGAGQGILTQSSFREGTTVTFTVSASSHDTRTQSVLVDNPKHLHFALGTWYPVTVGVYNLQGQPLGGAHVWGTANGYTNGAGQAVLNQMWFREGTPLAFGAALANHDTSYQNAVVDGPEQINFYLGTWYPVSIAVYNSRWQPISGASIGGSASGYTASGVGYLSQAMFREGTPLSFTVSAVHHDTQTQTAVVSGPVNLVYALGRWVPVHARLFKTNWQPIGGAAFNAWYFGNTATDGNGYSPTVYVREGTTLYSWAGKPGFEPQERWVTVNDPYEIVYNLRQYHSVRLVMGAVPNLPVAGYIDFNGNGARYSLSTNQSATANVIEGTYCSAASAMARSDGWRCYNVYSDVSVSHAVPLDVRDVIAHVTWDGRTWGGHKWWEIYANHSWLTGALAWSRAMGFSDAWASQGTIIGWNVHQFYDQAGTHLAATPGNCNYSGWHFLDMSGTPIYPQIYWDGPTCKLRNGGFYILPPNWNTFMLVRGAGFTPLKVNLKGANPTLNTTDAFRFDWDGFDDKQQPLMTSSGGLNKDEAWLVTDRKHNGIWKDGILDGDDVFGDHVGKYSTGYLDLKDTYKNELKPDEKGKQYIPLKSLAWWENLWIWICRFVGLDHSLHASYDLQLLTLDKKLIPAGEVFSRIYVDYEKANEWDAKHINWIGQRSKVMYRDGKTADSVDQWFTGFTDGVPSPSEKDLQKQAMSSVVDKGTGKKLPVRYVDEAVAKTIKTPPANPATNKMGQNYPGSKSL